MVSYIAIEALGHINFSDPFAQTPRPPLPFLKMDFFLSTEFIEEGIYGSQSYTAENVEEEPSQTLPPYPPPPSPEPEILLSPSSGEPLNSTSPPEDLVLPNEFYIKAIPQGRKAISRGLKAISRNRKGIPRSRITHECILCKQVFCRKSGAMKHVRGVHKNETPYHCNICKKDFKTKQNRKQHYKTRAHNREVIREAERSSPLAPCL